jgi:hypothetical protein
VMLVNGYPPNLPDESGREHHRQGELRATIQRVEYDAESVARQVEESGLPAEYAEGLLMAA